MGSVSTGQLRLRHVFLFLVVSLIPFPLFSFGKGEKAPPLTPIQNPTSVEMGKAGGFQAIPLEDPMVEEAITLLQEEMRKQEMETEGLKITGAERQVVAGYNIRLHYQWPNEDSGSALVYFPLGDGAKEVLFE